MKTIFKEWKLHKNISLQEIIFKVYDKVDLDYEMVITIRKYRPEEDHFVDEFWGEYIYTTDEDFLYQFGNYVQLDVLIMRYRIVDVDNNSQTPQIHIVVYIAE